MASDEPIPNAAAIRDAGGQISSSTTGRGWRVHFHLSGRGLTDEGLATLAPLGRDLLELNLRDTQITGAGMQHLAPLVGLRRLHLERTAVDDAGVAQLAGLGELRYLNLYSTRIGDAALGHLAGLQKLEQLFVWETGVTDAGIARLQRALPALEIVRGVDLDSEVFPTTEDEDAVAPEELAWMPAGADGPPRSKTGSFIIATFKNQRQQAVKLHWVEYGGGLRFYAEIAPGASREQTTYSNATWLITDLDDRPLGYFRTSLKPALAIIPAE